MTPELSDALRIILSRHLKESASRSLVEAIQYSALAPGKGIRSQLLLIFADLLAVTPSQSLPAAVALELGHCFTLVHDDLPCLDNDDWRRGQLANHKVFGEAMALLAGDALFHLSGQILLDIPHHTPAEAFTLLKVIQAFHRAFGMQGVIGGQALEMSLHDQSSWSDLQQVQFQKTASLFRLATEIPSLLSQQDTLNPQAHQTHLSIGEQFGLCFQWADDLEDSVPPYPAKTLLSHLPPEEAKQKLWQTLTTLKHSFSPDWPPMHTRKLAALVDSLFPLSSVSDSHACL